ncbi:MAG: DUF3142 domain-containing protein [Armatimonadetes bacterium]|nr:DUF3142 domain-containing protein [Armatimonadota bacterium]
MARSVDVTASARSACKNSAVKLRTAAALFGAVVLAGVIGSIVRPRPHPAPLQRSYWYWHSPFALTAEECRDLRSLGVGSLFVRAGTFSQNGREAVPVFPQSFGQGCGAFPVHLVFNGDAGFVRHFGDFETSALSASMCAVIRDSVQRAERAGVRVVGVQLDIDSPTRLLPRYSQIVRNVRAGLDRRLQFSVTGLTSWLGTEGALRLSREVDFMVPQAYEGKTGTTLSTVRPVSDKATLVTAMKKAESLACPYWIGIPAYGRAYLFDDKDRLVGTYKGLEAQDAFRHPSFRFVAGFGCDSGGRRVSGRKEWSGERILLFKAVRPAPDGRGVGYSLAFTVPAPDQPAESERLVQAQRGERCVGTILFRMPRQGSSFSLPLATVLSKVQGRSPRPGLDVDVTARQDAYDVVDGVRKQVPIDLWIEVKNTGDSPSAVDPDAVRLTIGLDRPGIEGVRLRDFDSVRYQRGSGEGGVECRPGEADRLIFTKRFIGFHERCVIGPLRLASNVLPHVTIAWSVMEPSGFDRVAAHRGPIAVALGQAGP